VSYTVNAFACQEEGKTRDVTSGGPETILVREFFGEG